MFLSIHNSDNILILRDIDENSVEAVVTDPPYGLAFMGKKWDYDVPSVELWREVLRVLKPGGYLLSFGGTRTYHRMVVNIEDAGFEIRDQLQWLYGSGFPKSTNIALRIDKELGAQGNRGKGFNTAGQGISLNQNKELRSDHPEYVKPEFKTSEAKQWSGFGSALKPANEPIVLARKPLEKGLTLAENVLKWGTGGLNIDGCRVETSGEDKAKHLAEWNRRQSISDNVVKVAGQKDVDLSGYAKEGRWPANLILDEVAAEMLDEQSGDKCGAAAPVKKKTTPDSTNFENYKKHTEVGDNGKSFRADSGGASRFFYVAKASKRERNAGLEGMPEKATHRNGAGIGEGLDPSAPSSDKNFHPTVKPIKLMQYLCRLVTPPKGIILDPFMGSGTTGVAALKEGFGFCGIELDPEYFEIASKRIKNVDHF